MECEVKVIEMAEGSRPDHLSSISNTYPHVRRELAPQATCPLTLPMHHEMQAYLHMNQIKCNAFLRSYKER